MVAVVAVILDHLVGWPVGGFIGVDVFFVISGFLITGLLLREHDRTGTISFIGFYRRRARRILPGAILVLIVGTVSTFLVFRAARATQVLGDAFYALFFGANWHFIFAGTDYFQQNVPPSPFQHFWSLAVEEQFYLVWPWLMLGIFATIGRRASLHRGHQAVAATMIIITGASLAWAMWETATNPTWAYFSTFSRAWELGVGALIAVFAGSLARIPDGIRPLLAWLGLAAIALSLFVVDGAAGFPAPWAALPVLGAALVILAGTGGEQRGLLPLTNPVSGWFGDLSYSLYLWHFPVIVILSGLIPTGVSFYMLAGALILILSIASYYGVEDPIRRSARGRRYSSGRRKEVYIFLGLLAATTGLLVYVGTLPRAAEAYSAHAFTAAPASSATASDPLQVKLSAKINAALASTDWPSDLQPSLDQLNDKAWSPEISVDGCLDILTTTDVTRCTYGPVGSKQTALVIGDSMAASWMPAIRGALPAYRISMFTLSGCPAFPLALASKKTAARCAAHENQEIQLIKQSNPDVVVVANLDVMGGSVSKATGSAFDIEWAEAGTELFSKIRQVPKVVMISVPPRGPNLNQCATAVSHPSDCTATVSEEWVGVTNAEKSAASSQKNVTYVDTSPWFCTTACPPFIGSTPVRVDGVHPVGKYVRSLGPLLAERLKDHL
jgi:peptidoglycan/LPS O-acetylase OafA/YrhL